jgi:hypothetical protein
MPTQPAVHQKARSHIMALLTTVQRGCGASLGRYPVVGTGSAVVMGVAHGVCVGWA